MKNNKKGGVFLKKLKVKIMKEIAIVFFLINAAWSITPVGNIVLPTLSSPSDATYESADGHNISWVVRGSHPNTYTVYRNSIKINSSTWNWGDLIIVSLDGLSVGLYYYTVIAYDSFGNSALDMVIISVIGEKLTI